MATSDDFARRTRLVVVLANLGWAIREANVAAPLAATLLVLQHLVEGIGPAIGIYATQRLVYAVIGLAGRGPGALRDALPWLLLFIASLLTESGMIWRLRDPLNLRLEQRLEATLGRRLLAKAAALPLTFFEANESYDRLERGKEPSRKTGEMYFHLLYLIRNVVQVISVAALFWPASPWLTLGLMGVVVPQAVLETNQSRRFMGFHYGRTERQRRSNYLERLITGRDEQKELRVFNLAPHLTARWQGMLKQLREEGLRLHGKQIRGQIVLFAFTYAVVLGSAAWLAVALARRDITTAAFVALFLGLDRLDAAAGALGFSVRELHTNAIDVGYVREVLELPEEPVPHEARPWPNALRDGIRFERVTFAYPGGRAPVLQDFTLHLQPDERVALVGENGAGKSTLVKLLLGLYKPHSGCITVDGIDLRTIDPESLRNHVTAVSQDYVNIELTAAHAIALGDPSALRPTAGEDLPRVDAARVRAAATRGGGDGVIARLPRGADTPIGHVLPGGQGLSGGQWQRLAISRAFMRDPAFLILDEPTAALDPQAEADVYAHFTRALSGRMGLLVSHRLGSARLADRIVVLKGGHVVEDGTHEQLLAAKGEYARMWEAQSQWYR